MHLDTLWGLPWPRALLLDGSMGTLLQQRGLLTEGCPEQLCLTAAEGLMQIHRDYQAAGVHAVTANTFGANRYKLHKYGLQDQVAALNTAAVTLARKAVGGGVKVLGDIGPTGALLAPAGDAQPQQLIEAFSCQMAAQVQAGVDGLIIETMMDAAEARCALIAARRVAPGLPVFLSFTLEGGRTLMGNPPQVLAVMAEQYGAVAVGFNCSGGPEQLLPHMAELARYTNLPLLAMPNAGLPTVKDGKTLFPLDPQAFVHGVTGLVQAGAVVLGGCCGTTPLHIAGLAGLLPGVHPQTRPEVPPHICSMRAAVPLAQVPGQAAMQLTGDVDDDLETLLDEAPGLPCITIDTGSATPQQIQTWLAAVQPLCSLPMAFICNEEDQQQAVARAYTGVTAVNGCVCLPD